MMKSRTSSYSVVHLPVIFVALDRVEALVREQRDQLAMPLWMKWMLVDSSGSMNPLDRPSATTLRFHALAAAAGGERRCGAASASGSPSRLASSSASRLVVAEMVAGNRPGRCPCGAGAGCATASPRCARSSG